MYGRFFNVRGTICNNLAAIGVCGGAIGIKLRKAKNAKKTADTDK